MPALIEVKMNRFVVERGRVEGEGGGVTPRRGSFGDI